MAWVKSSTNPDRSSPRNPRPAHGAVRCRPLLDREQDTLARRDSSSVPPSTCVHSSFFERQRETCPPDRRRTHNEAWPFFVYLEFCQSRQRRRSTHEISE